MSHTSPSISPFLAHQILTALSGIDTSAGLAITGHSLVRACPFTKALVVVAALVCMERWLLSVDSLLLDLPCRHAVMLSCCGQGAAMAALAAWDLSHSYNVVELYT